MKTLQGLKLLLADVDTPWIARLTGPRGHVEVDLSALIDVAEEANAFLGEHATRTDWLVDKKRLRAALAHLSARSAK